MSNFWQNLPKPFFALAPMDEVTDFAFREMFAKYSNINRPSRRIHSGDEDTIGKGRQRASASVGGENPSTEGSGFSPPNDFVMYTEFVNVDGLLHPEGFKRLSIDLKFSQIQRPMIAQIWGRSPIKFEEVARMLVDMGFDGVDINMGCPQDKEIGQGTCAALMREPELALEIVRATKKGAGNLPVSVKTRLGYEKNDIGNWLRRLLSVEPAAVAIHARTKKDKSKVPANWEAVAEAVKVRDQLKSATLIIGNGDIKSRADGLLRAQQSGCDGVMIGRGAFGHPWFFRTFGGENPGEGFSPPTATPFQGADSLGMNPMTISSYNSYQPSIKERLAVMLEHAELFDKEFAGIKSFQIMRKHFKAYASGFDGAHELRAKLMETKNLEETKTIVDDFLRQN